jgi:FixJ family two-component response regulator
MSSAVGTVFIVDDALEVRNSLSRLLNAAGYHIQGFESAEVFLQNQHAETGGCLLLDICLPGLSGMELQRQLLGSPHARPIVFLTGRGDIETSVAAMKAGAVDFLTKPIEAPRLFAAVDLALQRDAVQRLERQVQASIVARIARLTPRERQVMTCMMRGRLNKQIAGELGTGEKTVKVHRARVMSKMGVRSLAELVWLASRVAIDSLLTGRKSGETGATIAETQIYSVRDSGQLPAVRRYGISIGALAKA